MSLVDHSALLPVATLLVAAFAFVPFARAQRAIDVGSNPWKSANAATPELGELRLPDVRDLTPIDLGDFRGKPLLLIEFASW
ncbi:hypothetical protein Pla163_26770 [Planctomycetes bacterium Pla163]|uniref:AhpC/TSA family protein n=1 Tax=Rohdeia mirabilis TaxID=2528008 RepID=A0A518D273_9BACT|nr:hypothetical protein Pla163_26770 [Planctomycetes bacterium Pla163]